DHEQGGWMAWLSNDLKPDRSQPQGLIVHARILWAFSAAYHERPEPVYREMADRAFAYLMTRFRDPQHGGAFWRLDDRGQPLEDIKKTYGQAFCIYALAEYHRAFGSVEALEQARKFFELIEAHAHDPARSGYYEVCSRDWSTVLDAPLSDKDLNEKKSMNSHLHVLEAYTNLFRVWKDSRVEHRLRELISLFERQILDSRTFHLHHFFDEHWQVRSDTYTFGHDIEGSWLLCEAAEVLGDKPLLKRIEELALKMAGVALAEGIDETGGLCYEGKGGKVIDPRKECWPQAEAVVGFVNAFQLSHDPRFLHAAGRVWDYIDRNLVDRVHGEWFWRINADGQPDSSLPKVSEWKGPYHGSRMCLETLRRLKAST
ncbi:MAG: AGE family epimerase/isomerase, partial [Akkermansiaceae bacterium]|nr:AGE family epimerase/isomerase [Verrucomicrobiales bacterium]